MENDGGPKNKTEAKETGQVNRRERYALKQEQVLTPEHFTNIVILEPI